MPSQPSISPDEYVRQIRTDPWWYLEHLFGERCVYDKQEEIFRAVADPRVTEVICKACHDSGKTWICARAVIHFLLGHPHNSIVVTTAPTWQQVELLLWREIHAAYQKAKFPIGGKLLSTRLDFGPKWYAVGLSTNQPVNIQGFHADNILVVIDEADGVPPDIWTAIDGIVTTYGAKIVAIGNPLDPSSEFKKRHDLAISKPNARVITISAYDTPNLKAGRIVYPYLLSPGWVTDKLATWGEGSALAAGKIYAQWPDQGPDTFIPISWLLAAKGREVPRGARGLGVDVARFGRDRTVRTVVEGGLYLRAAVMSGAAIDVVAGATIADAMAYSPAVIAVDAVGLGAGVADIVRTRLGERFAVIDFNASSKAENEERFVNRAAEWWWRTRQLFDPAERKAGFVMDQPDQVDELINELNRAKVSYDERGRMKVDKYGMTRGKTEKSLSEEQLAARSPDRADSYVLAINAALPFANMREGLPGQDGYPAEIDWYAGTGRRA